MAEFFLLDIFIVPFLRMGRAAADWPLAAWQIRLISDIHLALAIPARMAGIWRIFG
ncbi:hypothetical protein ACJU26_10335 [Acidithiobacillus sp. M4-SHS-6]|uniref:hypothetical protein n=1 Tax=Acidithiobacillus sp. M4-SHS-6 TaxID=3383024 RepID=UPI0039BEC029